VTVPPNSDGQGTLEWSDGRRTVDGGSLLGTTMAANTWAPLGEVIPIAIHARLARLEGRRRWLLSLHVVSSRRSS